MSSNRGSTGSVLDSHARPVYSCASSPPSPRVADGRRDDGEPPHASPNSCCHRMVSRAAAAWHMFSCCSLSHAATRLRFPLRRRTGSCIVPLLQPSVVWSGEFQRRRREKLKQERTDSRSIFRADCLTSLCNFFSRFRNCFRVDCLILACLEPVRAALE
jgi:hypothetical protein